jgi:phage terminase large subunit-like protein
VKFTNIQQQAKILIAGPAKHVLLVGGSRSGKTFVALWAIALRAIASSQSRHVVLRFRFSHVKNTVVLDTFPKMMKMCFPEVSYRLDKSDWYAEFSNGSQIWFGGLDDKDRSDKILGAEFSTIFMNECSQITLSARDIALTRLSQNCSVDGSDKKLRLKALYDCNPPTKAHWTYKIFVKKMQGNGALLVNPDNYSYIVMNPKDNIENLPEDYLQELENLPPRMKQRFLEGKFAELAAGSLWNVDLIDNRRVLTVPDMRRIVVAVDPSGASDESENNDATGIIVAGLGTDGLGYCLEDRTIKGPPSVWGKEVITAYHRNDADIIVAEKNYGGEMVRHVLQSLDPNVKIELVVATRGKVVRAEPISAIMEQGRIWLHGRFEELEDELCSFTTDGVIGKSPNRADAFVWAFSFLFPIKGSTLHIWTKLAA